MPTRSSPSRSASSTCSTSRSRCSASGTGKMPKNARHRYNSTAPSTHVTVPPPTQMAPSASTETCTRPARPSAVPWLRDVRRARAAGGEQPLGHRRVQAAGHRVLDRRAVLREERPQLERLRRALRIRPDDAQVEVDEPRLERQHRVGVRPAAPRPSPARCRPTPRRRSPSARSAAPTRCARSGSRRPGPRAAAAARRTPARRRSGARARARRRTPARSRRPCAGCPPCSSQAWQVPSVGCPANGSSATRREDPHPVVGVRSWSAGARTSSRTGSSSGRTVASAPSRARRRRARRRPGCPRRADREDIHLFEGPLHGAESPTR